MDETHVASDGNISTWKMDAANNISSFDVEYYRQEFNAEFSSRILPVKILFALTATVGCVCNLFVVYIYGVKYKPCNFKYFLFVLGVIGLGQCVIMLPTQLAEMHYWFVFPTSWLCHFSAYVFGYTLIMCYLVLLLISVDRFRKVCRPYGWQIESRTARNLCFVASTVSLVFATPPGIVSGHHKYMTSYRDVNISVTVCYTDDMYQDREWPVYFLLLTGGTPVSIIIVVTCVLYGLILLQFWKGPTFPLKNIHRDYREKTRKPPSLGATPNNTPVHSNGNTPSNDVQTPDRKHNNNKQKNPIKNIFAILRKSESVESTSDCEQASSGPLKSTGSAITKCTLGVRRKLMRKTFIVLIITAGCIIAIIITFFLHIVAEDINRNVLSIPVLQLNAFVLFHRGSFSIICAIFPVVYGILDQNFRRAFRQIFGKSSAAKSVAVTSVNLSENAFESKC